VLGTCQSATESTSGAVSGGADPHKIPIDSNGNLSSKTEGTDNWTYSWNAENQLTKVERNGAEVARFAYDPNGRRVEKVAAGVTTTWTYDEETIVRQVRGESTLKYAHAPGFDRPLAVEGGTSVTYFHADGLGSIVSTTNAMGVVGLTRQYDAWGKLEAGANEPGYAFTGREWDSEVGLYYYRARYYDPTQGRFISEDPIRFRGGVNYYAYVKNDPVDAVDPMGLRLWKCSRRGEGAFFSNFNHAYFCDPDSGENCGMGGQNGKEQCPPKDPNIVCVPIDGADGNKGKDVMKCCQQKTKKEYKPSTWRPWHTCWELSKDCLDANGLKDPTVPGGPAGCATNCTGTPSHAPPPMP